MNHEEYDLAVSRNAHERLLAAGSRMQIAEVAEDEHEATGSRDPAQAYERAASPRIVDALAVRLRPCRVRDQLTEEPQYRDLAATWSQLAMILFGVYETAEAITVGQRAPRE